MYLYGSIFALLCFALLCFAHTGPYRAPFPIICVYMHLYGSIFALLCFALVCSYGLIFGPASCYICIFIYTDRYLLCFALLCSYGPIFGPVSCHICICIYTDRYLLCFALLCSYGPISGTDHMCTHALIRIDICFALLCFAHAGPDLVPFPLIYIPVYVLYTDRYLLCFALLCSYGPTFGPVFYHI